MAKRKSADFSKRKIRAGRKVPKHLNEDKPEFKAKRILIKSAIDQSIDPLNLLSSGNTLNSNLKQLYLSKLNQKILTNQHCSRGGEEIRVVCKYLTDYDSRVRQESIKCLKSCIGLLSNQSNEVTNLSPLFNIILTFINCAITHINESIRDDSQHFLSFVIERCDPSLDNNVMEMFLSKISSSWLRSLDKDYYKLLDKFVYKITSKSYDISNDTKEKSKPEDNSFVVLKWSTDNYCFDLKEKNNLNSQFGNVQSFSLTFQNKSQINIRDKFLDSIKQMIFKDVSSLIGRRRQCFLNVSDGQKAICALRILFQLGFQRELLKYWKNNGSDVPHVNIIEDNMRKSSKVSKDKSHTQNSINCILNKYRKNTFQKQ